MEEGTKHMRRMLLPEVKIKSKLKDDVEIIYIEELLTHGYVSNQDFPSDKTLILQTVSQQAGDKDDGEGGIYFSDSNTLSTEITNATLTISTLNDVEFIA